MSDKKYDKEQELIQVTDGEIGGIKQPVVDGRALHGVMGVSRDFTSWMKKRISDYGFQEGIDYLLTKTGEQLPSGTKYSSDYTLTLDMAKELAMVERNEMGRKVRRYFIECEQKLLVERANSRSDTDLSEEEKEEILFIGEAARERIQFWALEKRDRIYHAGMNRDILFSITCDIQHSLFRELLFDYKCFLKSDKDLSFSGQIMFFETWEPEYIKEERRRNKTMKG